MRLAGSSGANPFACISAGIGALWGPAHGGANEAVLKMLNEIGAVKYAKLEKPQDKAVFLKEKFLSVKPMDIIDQSFKRLKKAD